MTGASPKTAEQQLEELGFRHYLSDEPHEDHWILEGIPGQPDLLAERTTSGWGLLRSPNEAEPESDWVDIASDLDDEALLNAIHPLT